MNVHRAGRWIASAVFTVATLGAGSAVLAQTTPPPPQLVTIVDNTQFTQLYQDVILQPGDKDERDMDIGGFARMSVLASAVSDSAAMGRVGVHIGFGPPAVPADNAKIVLAFKGGTDARDGTTHPVMGPRLHVTVVNNTNQPVTVNLSVYAVK
jgi:hypothetical protein